MEIDVKDDKIDVQVDYELDVNHEPLADCKIKMNIMPKSQALVMEKFRSQPVS